MYIINIICGCVWKHSISPVTGITNGENNDKPVDLGVAIFRQIQYVK
jgi:hypothetical protein